MSLFISTLRYGTGSFSQLPWSWYVSDYLAVDATFTTKPFQILVGILRHYIVVLLQSPPKQLPRAALREQCVIETEFFKIVKLLNECSDVL